MMTENQSEKTRWNLLHRRALSLVQRLYLSPRTVQRYAASKSRWTIARKLAEIYFHTWPYILLIATIGRCTIVSALGIDLAESPSGDQSAFQMHGRHLLLGVVMGAVAGCIFGVALELLSMLAQRHLVGGTLAIALAVAIGVNIYFQ